MSAVQTVKNIISRVRLRIQSVLRQVTLAWATLWFKFVVFGLIGAALLVTFVVFLEHEGLSIFGSQKFFEEENNNGEALRNAVLTFTAMGGGFAAFLIFANSIHRTNQKDREISQKDLELNSFRERIAADDQNRKLELDVSRRRLNADLFGRALEQMTNVSATIRSGGIYTLEQLIIEELRRNTPDIGFVRNLTGTLCAYARSAHEESTPQSTEDAVAVFLLIARSVPYSFRTESGQGVLDFTGIDLTVADIPTGTDLRKFQLRKANFESAVLHDLRFEKANLAYAVFKKALVLGCDFSNSWMWDANFSNTVFNNCKFNGADVSDADFEGSDITFHDIQAMTWTRNSSPKGLTGDIGLAIENRNSQMR